MKLTRRVLPGICLILPMVLLSGEFSPVGAEVGDADLARPAGKEWLHVNGDWAGTRYSTLSELNPCNAHELKLAWRLSLGVIGKNQATPIYHDGVLYFSTYNQRVLAVDARSKKLLWKYEHQFPEHFGGPIHGFLGPINKGVAIYRDKIYFISNDNVLIAFHYKTGKELWRLRLRNYIRTLPIGNTSQYRPGYWSTIAPLVIPGKVIAGMNATDAGGLPGYLDAVDAETGRKLWSANMIPVGDEPGADSWPGESAKTGGAGPWITGSYDPELNLVFTGTANAWPWNLSGGDLVGASSIVAVHAESGAVAWRYTVVPGDRYDYDSAQTPMVITLNGRKTVVQANKTGFVHFLDAATGDFQRAVPLGVKVTWAKGYGPDGRPYGVAAMTEPVPRSGSCFGRAKLPEAGKYIELWPSWTGAVNLFASSYSPRSGMLYIPARESGFLWWYIQGGFPGACFNPIGKAQEVEIAMDLESGRNAWMRTRSFDGFAAGMLSTAGDLVMFGGGDRKFRVVDAVTGKELWTHAPGKTFQSGPITYELDGKQYVAQLVGGWYPPYPPNTQIGELLVFSR